MAGDVTPYIDHITLEHGNKPKFVSMVEATVQPFADTLSLYKIIPLLYDVDTAQGQQLDVVGEWVGVSRYLTLPLAGVYFAFDTVDVGFDAGVWKGPYDPETGLTALPDEFYRLVIKAKILNNNWDGSKDQVYVLADIIFGSQGFTYYIEDNGDMSINLGLLGPTPPPPVLTALFNSGVLDVKGITIRIASRVAQQGPIFAFDLDTLFFKGFDSGYWPINI
jgi:hypothetical protein